ncbi:hypothetical protein ABBQ38_006681 [Trebouxia sp. C0009 RCD-2024]
MGLALHTALLQISTAAQHQSALLHSTSAQQPSEDPLHLCFSLRQAGNSRAFLYRYTYALCMHTELLYFSTAAQHQCPETQ